MGLRQLRIPVKLGIILVIAAIGVGIAGWLHVRDIRPRELDARKVRTQQLVESALSVVSRYHDEQVSGALTEREAKRRALDAVAGMSYGEDGYFWINDMTPRMVMHPKKPELNGKDLSADVDPNGKKLFVAMVDTVRAHQAGFVDYEWPKPGNEKPVPKLSYVAGFQPWGWVVGSGIYIDDVDAAVRSATTSMILQTILIVAAISLAIFLVSRSISRPVAKLSRALARLSHGDVEEDADARGDELPETAESFRQLTRYLNEQAAVARRVAEGDLAAEVVPRSERDVLGHATATMVGSLRSIIARVSRAAAVVDTATHEMATSSDEAGKAIGEIAIAVGDVAGGAERQVRMVEEANASMARTADAAEKARHVSREGAATAAQVSEAMDALRASSAAVDAAISSLVEKSERIGGIVDAITAISGQTNLLALNAAIEAARAGDHGRGFAVVADEVRKLADESQHAAATIAAVVAEIQSETGHAFAVIEEGTRRSEQGVETVGAARDAFEAIGASVDDVTDQVNEMAGAIREIAAVAEQSSASSQEVSASTEETTASTQEIAASAQELAQVAEELNALVGGFALGDTAEQEVAATVEVE